MRNKNNKKTIKINRKAGVKINASYDIYPVSISKQLSDAVKIIKKNKKSKTKLINSPFDNRIVSLRRTRKREQANENRRVTRMNELIERKRNTFSDPKFVDNFKSFLGSNKMYLINEEILNPQNPINFLPINVGEYINFSTTWLRTIYGDFMGLLRRDSPELIDTTIKETCDNNYKKFSKNRKYPVCYCCGNTILPKQQKACDHLIPIMTMLIIVDPESIKDNLFHIHYKCNGEKSNHNLMTMYDIAGTNFFSNCKGNTYSNQNQCRKPFVSDMTSARHLVKGRVISFRVAL